MTESTAQRKANLKYRRNKTKQIAVVFYPDDMDAWEWLQQQPRKAEYVRELIREDREKAGKHLQ